MFTIKFKGKNSTTEADELVECETRKEALQVMAECKKEMGEEYTFWVVDPLGNRVYENTIPMV